MLERQVMGIRSKEKMSANEIEKASMREAAKAVLAFRDKRMPKLTRVVIA